MPLTEVSGMLATWRMLSLWTTSSTPGTAPLAMAASVSASPAL